MARASAVGWREAKGLRGGAALALPGPARDAAPDADGEDADAEGVAQAPDGHQIFPPNVTMRLGMENLESLSKMSASTSRSTNS